MSIGISEEHAELARSLREWAGSLDGRAAARDAESDAAATFASAWKACVEMGVATYLMSIIQGGTTGGGSGEPAGGSSDQTERIAGLFDATGFWDVIVADPFSRAEWLTAVKLAPSIKEGYYTVMTSRDVYPEVERLLNEDARLSRCFR